MTPFLGVPNMFQDAAVSILSLLIIALIVFSKYLEGSLIKPRSGQVFDESSPETDDSFVVEPVQNKKFVEEKAENLSEKIEDFSSENLKENTEFKEVQKL